MFLLFQGCINSLFEFENLLDAPEHIVVDWEVIAEESDVIAHVAEQTTHLRSQVDNVRWTLVLKITPLKMY